jgi:hypothetical protein
MSSFAHIVPLSYSCTTPSAQANRPPSLRKPTGPRSSNAQRRRLTHAISQVSPEPPLAVQRAACEGVCATSGCRPPYHISRQLPGTAWHRRSDGYRPSMLTTCVEYCRLPDAVKRNPTIVAITSSDHGSCKRHPILSVCSPARFSFQRSSNPLVLCSSLSH